MCPKYPDHVFVAALRSRHCFCKASSRSGKRQFVDSISFKVMVTSPSTTSTTINWNIAISLDTFVASNTGPERGGVEDLCHHMTQRMLFSSAYAFANSRRVGHPSMP